jgi:hypothetical protein
MTSPSAERTGIDGFGIASLVLGMQGCYPSRDFCRPLWHCCLVTCSRSHRGNSQPATAGIVLGWIGVILGVTVMFVYFVLLGVSASGDPSLPLVAQCSLIVHMTNQTAPRFR